MTCRAFVRVFAFGALLLVPGLVYGQDTALAGSVADATDAVLPGVTVTAIHVDSGNTFNAVTDERGAYRIGAMRPGVYRITAELAGFTTAIRENVQLLLGQRAALDFRLTLSTVQETVTVTSEAPLLETSLSRLGGNIDTRQVESLPVNGRNWMDLTMLAPGSRANSVRDDVPLASTSGNGMQFQINLDGQQLTNTIIASSAVGQPQMSRDAIGEFEFVTNRFDATQGRSSGVQVNAITKAGTNNFAGTASGYFRSDKLNAEDFFTGTVLPYSNQQISATFGGPIRRDRVHFFTNYEYERQPQTFAFTSPWPSFNIAPVTSVFRVDKGAGKVDVQLSSNTRVMGRANTFRNNIPFWPHPPAGGYGGTLHPSAGGSGSKENYETFGSLTQVFGQRLNELKGGYLIYNQIAGLTVDAPLVLLRNYRIGPPSDWPQRLVQSVWQIRDDFTFSLEARGRHDMKVGGEYLRKLTDFRIDTSNLRGTIDATSGPVPANIEALFPVWNDPSTWNLAALSPITVRYTENIASGDGTGAFKDPKNIGALYVQDNWALTDALTVNLGLRWDWETGAFAEDLTVEPFLPEERGHDWDNIQPRFGFAYTLPGKMTVVRGGVGKYYPEMADTPNWNMKRGLGLAQAFVPNDGRPDFSANPYNGRPPTFEQVAAVKPRSLASSIVSPNLDFPYSWQSSIGVQQQVGNTISVQADFVHTADRNTHNGRQLNLSYDPVTGINYPFSDVSKRPYAPDWGSVNMTFPGDPRVLADYYALQTAVTKRFSDRWQGSLTYTLGFQYNQNDADEYQRTCVIAGAFAPCPAGFRLAEDLRSPRDLSNGDQRHRAVFNGIWDLPMGFQLSGLYFFGSGERRSVSAGVGDIRDSLGGSRLRRDGSIVPYDATIPVDALHRVDMRVMKSTSIGGGIRLEGMLEVFNLFNHRNYGTYVTSETSALFGRPQPNNSVAYAPRMMQLGFRVAF